MSCVASLIDGKTLGGRGAGRIESIPREIAARLLLAIGGIVFLLWVGLDIYLERKHMTAARRMEVEAERTEGVTRPKRHIWHIVGPILMIGVPALFIVDGLIFRIGCSTPPSCLSSTPSTPMSRLQASS